MFKSGLGKCFLLYFIIFNVYLGKSNSAFTTMGKKQRHRKLILDEKHDIKGSADVSNPDVDSSNDDKRNDNKNSQDRDLGFDLTEEEILKFKIWPQGNVPYYIDVYSYKDKILRDKIRSFLDMVNSVANLNFMELPRPPKDDKTRWVFFVNRRGLLGCADHSIKNFTNEGVQQVILGYDCMSSGGDLAEAVLAIVGVPPQHNAPNRDKYIKVFGENIIPDKKYLYTKLKDNEWLFHDIDYDFNSAGHYHFHKYSTNGRATIESLDGSVDLDENRELSKPDIRKIKMLYHYISKNNQLHVPECEQLFEPGINFDNYIPETNNKQPREKPSKYIGRPDKRKIKKNENIEENYEEEPINDSSKEQSSDPNEEIIDEESFNQSGRGRKNGTDDLRNKNLKLNYQAKSDPLTYLSDYKTDEEYKQKRAKDMKTENPRKL